jgi:hypothetical protein
VVVAAAVVVAVRRARSRKPSARRRRVRPGSVPGAIRRPAPLAADDEDADEDSSRAPPRAADQPVRLGLGFPDRDTRVGSRAPRAPLVDEEDFEEPEIPEYLIAEQRRSGNRGAPGRAAVARAAVAPPTSRRWSASATAAAQVGAAASIRYPDVSGRTRPAAPARDDRNYSRGNDRPAPAPAGRSSNEPWSDVPPELEALLRAQVAQKPPVSRPAAATQTDDPGVTSEAAAVREW